MVEDPDFIGPHFNRNLAAQRERILLLKDGKRKKLCCVDLDSVVHRSVGEFNPPPLPDAGTTRSAYSKSGNQVLLAERCEMLPLRGLALYDLATKEAKDLDSACIRSSFQADQVEVGVATLLSFRFHFKEAEEKLSGLNRKWTSELGARLSLETEALETENTLRLHDTEKEKLKEKICALTAIVDEKDKLVREEADALAKEKEKVEISSQEFDQLRVQIDQPQMSMSKSSEESQVFKRNLDAAMEEIEPYKREISSSREMLELATKELSKSVEKKCVLLAVSQEKQNALSLSEARERDHLEQLDSVKCLGIGLSKRLSDFEHRAKEDLQRNRLWQNSSRPSFTVACLVYHALTPDCWFYFASAGSLLSYFCRSYISWDTSPLHDLCCDYLATCHCRLIETEEEPLLVRWRE